MYNYRCPNCSILLSLPQNINEPKCPSCGHICKIEHDTIKDAPCQALGAYSQSNSIYNQYPKEPDLFENGQSGKSRGLAGLFAILLGWLGVHYFYVNKPTGGGIMHPSNIHHMRTMEFHILNSGNNYFNHATKRI